jgi:threonine dehydrogenase-like Zn-dependent dehydrogenase
MKGTTRFGVLVADKRAEVHSHEIPEIMADEVLMHNVACNICTFDYQQWLGLRPQQPYPQAFGHEDAGMIVAVGPEVENLKTGDHVVPNIYYPCLQCRNCQNGLNMRLCENKIEPVHNKDKYGYYGPYGCSQYKIIKAKHVIKVDKNVPLEAICFVEPVSTAIHGLRKIRIKANEKVLVIGIGSMGLLNAQLAQYYGADVIISELMEKKIEVAKKMGFKKIINPHEGRFEEQLKEYTGGNGPSAIIIAVGVTQAYEQAFSVGPEMCRFLIFAANFPAPKWNIDPNLVHYRLWEIYGTIGSALSDYREAVDIISSGALNFEDIIEARYPLDKVQMAFEHAAKPGSYRVNVTIPD